jgi:hypothetical protein
MGRTTRSREPAQIQRDLVRFLENHTPERNHQGYRLGGRTPAQALRESLGTSELPPLVSPEREEVEPTAA